jgi:hypothetical protein
MEIDQGDTPSTESLAWLQKIYDHGVSLDENISTTRGLRREARLISSRSLRPGCKLLQLIVEVELLLIHVVATPVQSQKSTNNESLFSYFRGQTKKDDLTVSFRCSCS